MLYQKENKSVIEQSILNAPRLFNLQAELDADAWIALADRYLRHEFDVLGSGWVNVRYGMTAKGFEEINYSDTSVTLESALQDLSPEKLNNAHQLLEHAAQLVEGYIPIDWHIDFKSGYRSKLLHHTQLGYGTTDGVDMKVTADLSRLYHLPILAMAWRATGNTSYLNEILAQTFDWMASNPWEYGPAWRANMNVSIRVSNLIVTFDLIRDGLDMKCAQHVAFCECLQRSFVQHRQYICANLEFPEDHYHPNHYVANLAGLLVTTSFCRGWDDESDAWRILAIRELQKEIDRQVLADGVQFEVATSYHALVLEMFVAGFCLAARADGSEDAEGIRNWISGHIGEERLGVLKNMFSVLRNISGKQGILPLIGDTDGGRFLCLETPGHNPCDWRFLSALGADLFEDVSLLGTRAEATRKERSMSQLLVGETLKSGVPSARASVSYPVAGLYIMRGGGAFSMISSGMIGTDGKGGHAHNDKLAFTLEIDGTAVFVDPGIYVYTASREYRNAHRSVHAHNTVAVGGEEQNRYLQDSPWWGCHEDTNCQCLLWESDDEHDLFEGEHVGYQRLQIPVKHRRRIELDKKNQLMVVRDSFIHDENSLLPSMLWTFNLHPGCRIAEVNGPKSVIMNDNITLKLSTTRGEWSHSEGFYSPSYGIRQACLRLELRLEKGVPDNEIIINW